MNVLEWSAYFSSLKRREDNVLDFSVSPQGETTEN